MPRVAPSAVLVSGIRLVTVGAPGAPDERLEVHAEVDGVWRCVIDELKDGPISHIVEPAGITNSPRACVEVRDIGQGGRY